MNLATILGIVLFLFGFCGGQYQSRRRPIRTQGGWKDGGWKTEHLRRRRNYRKMIGNLVKSFPEKICPIDLSSVRITTTTNDGSADSGLLDTFGSWCASTDNDPADHITIEFGSPKRVEGIATQGSSTTTRFVRSFVVRYTNDTSIFRRFNEGGTEEVFTGNVDNLSAVNNKFSQPITAKFIRIIPKDYFGGKCMRVGLFDCEATQEGDMQSYGWHHL